MTLSSSSSWALDPAIVLVRPQLGENIGTAARAMHNFGLTELRLVEPKCGWPNVKALQAASGATEVLNRLQTFTRVEAAVADLEVLFATTARPRDLPKRVVSAAGAAREARTALREGRRVGVLFGPERTGLSNDDLIFADAVLSVPLNPELPSPIDTRAALTYLASKRIDDPDAVQYVPRLLEVGPGHLVAEHDPA